MWIFKQKASQTIRGSVVEDEVTELVRAPDYTWPRNDHRFDFYSVQQEATGNDKQRSEIIFVIKMVIASTTEKLPGA